MQLQQKYRFLPSEGLKLIACLCMLIDHAAAIFIHAAALRTQTGIQIYYILRGVGRLAFPIYCWMLAEGVHYTRDPWKYGLRLAVAAVISEFPFDMALKGGITWEYQNVFVTLLLGFVAVELIRNVEKPYLKVLGGIACILLAEVCKTDYGGWGVALIIAMYLARGRLWLQAVLTAVICWLIGGFKVSFLGLEIPIEMYGILAMLPIACCSGRKWSRSKAVQIGFYLFYPAHLLILWGAFQLMFG